MESNYLFVEDNTTEIVWSDRVINKKGVCLEKFEIEILKMVYTYKIVTSKMITDMYVQYRPNSSRKSVSNRLSRLTTKKILHQKKQQNAFGYGITYFYTVGTKGLSVLKTLQGFKVQNSYEPHRIRIPTLHNHFATQTVHDFYIANMKQDNPFKVKIVRGVLHELFPFQSGVLMRNGVELENKSPIIPDYVLEKDDTLICLESDMGTERTHEIKNKVQMYTHIAKSERFKDKKIYVVYSVVDKDGDSTISKGKRIHSLKSAHTPKSNWPDNLEFYVTSSNEVIKLLFLLLENAYPLSIIWRNAAISDTSNQLMQSLQDKHGWRTHDIEIEELLIEPKDDLIMPANLMAQRVLSPKGIVKTVVFISGEFGSVRTYQELQTVTKVLSKLKGLSFKQEYLPLEIYICYPRSVDLEREYFGFPPVFPIYMVDVQNWVGNESNQMRGLQLITAYKKEWKEW